MLESAARTRQPTAHRTKISPEDYATLISCAFYSEKQDIIFTAALIICLFRAFLRVGEVRSLKKSDLIPDGSFSFSINVAKSKTDQTSRGACVKFVLQPNSQELRLLNKHINNVHSLPSPFLFPSQSTKRPLSAATISTKLRNLFQLAGLENKGYTSHSFRGGAASTALEQGFDSSRVMSAGRWRSSKSFQAYIRPSALNIIIPPK
ncbi:hypothetical protein Y032_0609g615 [Ancylostoma ceylanicum]|uniref:Tyr recombinase domain-containing protein n=1 Tax=Ancylostoma ceylanicum TaxID=53326 RepID=A0A016WL33_9BILA|nr:hypothetical protein Y032_0609g615 [Ancylostoma ceylanicum]